MKKHLSLKKFTAVLVLAAYTLSVFAFSQISAFAAESLSQGGKGVLEKFGTTLDEETLGEPLTRGTFALDLSKIVLPGEYNAEEVSFFDVDPESDEGKAVSMLVKMGIVSGFPDGSFKPDEKIEYGHVLTMILRVCGLYNRDTSTGNLLKMAYELGVSRNSGLSLSDFLTREQGLMLLYKTLSVDVPRYFGEDLDLSDFLPYAKARLNLSYVEGTVTEADGLSLYGESNLKEGYIKIEGDLYAYDGSVQNLLGRRVEAWYEKEGGDSVLFSLCVSAKNKTESFEARNLEEYKNRVYEYSLDDFDDKTKKATLDKGFYVIYNGKPVGKNTAASFDSAMLSPKSGKITLLDNNGDDLFDLVFVDSYEYRVIERVDAGKNTLYLKQGAPITNIDYQEWVITLNGKKIADISALAEESVVTFMQRLDGTGEIHVSTNYVEGTVEKVLSTEEKIVIAGGTYVYADTIEKVPSPGDEGKFYLAEDGTVVYFKSSSGSWSYAYVMGVSAKGSLGGNYRLKILDETGLVREAQCSEKVRIDGKKPADNSDFVSFLTVGGETKDYVIRYSANAEGVINAVDTPLLSSEDGQIRQTLNLDGTDRYYRKGENTFGGYDALVTDDTKIFFASPTFEDSKQKVLNASSLETKTYSVKGYVTDDDTIRLAAVIVRNQDASFGETRPAFITELCKTRYEDQDMIKFKCIGYGGNSYEFYVEEEKTTKNYDGYPTLSLDVGDIIVYANNGDGTVDDIAYVYDVDTDTYIGLAGLEKLINTSYDRSYCEKFEGYMARILKKEKDAALFVLTPDALSGTAEEIQTKSYYEPHTGASISNAVRLHPLDFPVYVYRTVQGKKVIEKGSNSDLSGYLSNSGLDSKVFYLTRYTYRDYILIYE